MNRLVLCTAVLAGLATIASAAPKGDPKAGKVAYQKHCQMCHGPEGQGNPTLARMLKAEIRPLSSKEVQALSDAEIRTIIEKGKGKMKPVQNLTPGDIDNIIAFVRTLAHGK
jgi:mono/diheme cytochrome c family protein